MENKPSTETPAGGASQQPGATTKSRTRSVQNQDIAEFITSAAQLIHKVQGHPEIAALLTPRGYGPDALAAGLALQAAAQAAFDARQTALGVVHEAKQARDAALAAAREEYTDFRQTAQARFDDMATRQALGVSGRIPTDLQKFVTQATASYRTAQQPAYAETFALRSFTTERLTAALAALQHLLALDNTYREASGGAITETGDRNDAAGELADWIGEFRANLQLALKKTPEHLQTLGL